MISVDKKQIQTYLHQWLPALFILVFILLIPPLGFAIILAFFTAPLVQSVISITRLPAFLAALIVMATLAFLLYAFIFFSINGLISVLWTVEDHLILAVEMIDERGWNINELSEGLIQSSHEALEGLLGFFQTLFQRLFGIFMFAIAYFFSLRESAGNRYWFLVYFPKKYRPAAKRIFARAASLMGAFFSVQIRLFLVTFTLMSLGFWLLGFESFLTKAFLISLVDSIPFLGIGLVFLPMIAFSFYVENLYLAIGLLILYVILLITRQMTESVLWAHTFKLRTVHSFIITACAVYLFGLYGILFLPFFLFMALKVKEHPSFT